MLASMGRFGFRNGPRRPGRTRFQAGQSIVEFALVAPMIMFIVAIVFTGTQYMNAVVGLDSSARAGALTVAADIAANPGANNTILTDDAVLAVNREQGITPCPGKGAPPCFVASYSGRAGCPVNGNCVWVDSLINPISNRSIELVHVAYTVKSYLAFIPTTAVSAQAGAE